MKETTIFNGNDYFSTEAMEETANFLKEMHVTESPNDNDCYVLQTSSMNDDFQELKETLSVDIDKKIIGIANIKTWNGYIKCFNVFSEDLSNILYLPSDSELETFVVSMESDIKTIAYHHDGYYNIIYRALKSGISEYSLNEALRKWKVNNDITRFLQITDSIVPYVCNVLNIETQEENIAV